MVTLTVHCDRCRAQITQGRVALDLRCGEILPGRPSVDLCPECVHKFTRWLEPSAPTVDVSAFDLNPREVTE